MKKLFSLTLASAALASCGASKGATKTSSKTGMISYPEVKANQETDALNKLKRDESLRSVKHVTDGGQVTDKSFNQTIWKGVSEFAGNNQEYYVIPASAKPQELETTYAAIMKNTQVLVAGGFQHEAPLRKFKSQLKDNQGIIFMDGEIKAKNIMSVLFKVEEAAFYAGYFAAQYLSENRTEFDVKGSEGLKVGTYGGMNFPTVTGFMGGFQQGVEFWNQNLPEKGVKVEFIKLGSNAEAYFSGNFKQGTGKAISEKLINAGADVILPVAGPQTLDTLSVIQEKGAKTLVVGVDTDQSIAYDNYSNKFLTSILKNLDIAGKKGLEHILGGISHEEFGLGKTVIGTIKNDLVGLASGGTNKLNKGQWELLKEDQKLSAAAAKATNTFKL